MRKILFLMAVLLSAFTGVASAETVTVDNVTVGRGGKVKLYIGVTNREIQWRAFQMDISLPEGFTMKYDSETNTPEVVRTDRLSEKLFSMATNYQTDKDVYSLASVHTTAKGLELGSGPLFYMTIIAGDDVADGTYTGTISRIIFTNESEQSVHFDNATFTITVSGEAITGITLDENNTEALTATTEATDITVKRTINADEWSTLVLPFSMTGDELTSAFGESAQMAEFSAWTPSDDTDADENPLSIEMVFTAKALSEELEANHPVLIRLDHAITEFTVADKTIEPEDEPSVEVNMTGSTSKKKRANLVGSYTPITIDEEMLFISGNKFYYSTGKTKMKGFRAYFSVPQTISAYYNSSSSAKNITLTIADGTATGISKVSAEAVADGRIYSIEGQYVGNDISSLPAGIYVVNGKKVLVK